MYRPNAALLYRTFITLILPWTLSVIQRHTAFELCSAIQNKAGRCRGHRKCFEARVHKAAMIWIYHRTITPAQPYITEREMYEWYTWWLFGYSQPPQHPTLFLLGAVTEIKGLTNWVLKMKSGVWGWTVSSIKSESRNKGCSPSFITMSFSLTNETPWYCHCC